MKHSIGYTLNPKGATFTFDEDVFKGSLAAVQGSVGYAFEHVFEGPKLILRSTIVASGVGRHFLERIEKVKESYGIAPYLVKSNGNDIEAVYRYRKTCSETEQGHIKFIMEELLQVTCDEKYRYDGEIISQDDTEYCEPKKILLLKPILIPDYSPIGLSGKNLAQADQADKISIIDVVTRLGVDDPSVCDPIANIHPKYGKPFRYILGKLESINQAMNFFSGEFDVQFQVYEQIAEIFDRAGARVTELQGCIAGGGGYCVYDEKSGGQRQISDFLVDVHYRVQTNSENTFIVTLTNPVSHETIKKVRWPNASNKGKLSEWLQKNGNFHFSGGDKEVLQLHKEIANKFPPHVRTIVGFGYKQKEQIIIFRNGTWDLNAKVFCERQPDSPYWFAADGRGFLPVDVVGNPIESSVAAYAPSVLSTASTKTYEQIVGPLKPLYTDLTYHLPVMFAMSILGFSMFAQESGAVHPMFFLRGVTGSGKSTFGTILKRLLGIGAEQSVPFRTTKFSLSNLLCNLERFPLFITEFRDNRKAEGEEDPRSAMFRSVYDRTRDTKGRSDLSIVSYDYVAIPIFDAEECFSDGALRNRCIQKQMKRGIRGNVSAVDILREWQSDDFLYSYLMGSSRERYEAAYKEGYELFFDKNSDPRLSENIRRMYAGAMAFAKDNRDDILNVLKEVMDTNQQDFEENGTSQDIIKAVSKYLSYNRSTSYVKGNLAIVPWNELSEYVHRNKVKMSLGGFDNYMEHIEAIGYEIDYYEVVDEYLKGKKVVRGIGIPAEKLIPPFLVNPDFYALKKKYEERKLTAG